MIQCRSCGGTYQATGRDGVAYFHACAPLAPWELAAAAQAGLVALPIDPATSLPEPAAVAVTRRLYTRATARDENVQRVVLALGQTAPIVAPGAGVQLVPDPPSSVVVVPVAAALAPAPPAPPV